MRGKRRQLAGQRFGKRLVIQETPRGQRQRGTWWLVRCDCGREESVSGASLMQGSQACVKCAHKGFPVRHGHWQGGKGTRVHAVWSSMKSRCLNPRSQAYGNYGGRGISVCEKWKNFTGFLADMGECAPGMTLERKDNNGNYEPSNCYWASRTQQTRNRRCSIHLTFLGRTLHLKEWSDRTGLPYRLLCSRVGRGWSTEKTLTTMLHLRPSTIPDSEEAWG